MTYTLSNFYRTKGATDEKERKKRSVKRYLIGAGGAGAVGVGALNYDKIKNTIDTKLPEMQKWYGNIPNKKRLGITIAGGGLATVLGTKAYLNHKKNKRNQERYDNSLEGKVSKIKSKIKENTKGSFNTLFPKYE